MGLGLAACRLLTRLPSLLHVHFPPGSGCGRHRELRPIQKRKSGSHSPPQLSNAYFGIQGFSTVFHSIVITSFFFLNQKLVYELSLRNRRQFSQRQFSHKLIFQPCSPTAKTCHKVTPLVGAKRFSPNRRSLCGEIRYHPPLLFPPAPTFLQQLLGV